MDSGGSNTKIVATLTGILGFLVASKAYELINGKSEPPKVEPELESKKKFDYATQSPDSRVKSTPSSQRKQNIYRIVITGGPCSGKTTMIPEIADRLRERGFRVYTAPEAAALAFGAGVTKDFDKLTTHQKLRYFRAMASYVMDHEDKFLEFANTGDIPTVIICNRGVVDLQKYMEHSTWQALLDECGWNAVELRDKRYDGVIHLVTAADGAESVYTEKFKSKYELNVNQAIEVDKKLRASWCGHPQFYVVDNRKEFIEKKQKAFDAVARILGIQTEAPKFFSKHLLKKTKSELPAPFLPPELSIEMFTIDDTFLESNKPNVEVKVRKRGQNGSYFYQLYTTTYPRDADIGKEDWQNDGNEVKKQISPQEYLTLLATKDKQRDTLQKVRKSFFWKGHYIFIDTFLNCNGGFSLLFCDKALTMSDLKLPSTITVDREVSQDKEYSSYNLAKIENLHKPLIMN